MEPLNDYQKRQLCEQFELESFILIGVDSPLPCKETREGGECTEPHNLEVSIHRIDHKSAVKLLKQAHEIVMYEGTDKH